MNAVVQLRLTRVSVRPINRPKRVQFLHFISASVGETLGLFWIIREVISEFEQEVVGRETRFAVDAFFGRIAGAQRKLEAKLDPTIVGVENNDPWVRFDCWCYRRTDLG